MPMPEELPGPPRVVLPERLVDVGLAVGLALVVIIAETFGERTATDTMAEIVLGVGGALALLERRRWPMAVLAVNAAIVAARGCSGCAWSAPRRSSSRSTPSVPGDRGTRG